MTTTTDEISAAYAAQGRTHLATANPRHRSPVHPDVTVVGASNEDLRAELDYRNAGTDERTQVRYQKYAVRFILDAELGEEPSAANLARVLGRCIRPPRPVEYATIRQHVDTYRMAQMSATDAVRDKLTERAGWYETEAPVDPNLRTLLNRRIAEELRKFAASL